MPAGKNYIFVIFLLFYGKHGGTLVCHLFQDLKVPGSNPIKTKSFFLFFYIHLGYSLNFAVVYLCHITRGIPPPGDGKVGKIKIITNDSYNTLSMFTS